MRATPPPRAAIAAPLLVLAALAWVPAGAAAQHDGVRIRQPFTGQRAPELNLHGGVSHRGPGLAAGLRAAVPIVDNGFVSSIDNAIYLTVGGDLFFERCIDCGKHNKDYGIAVAVPLTGRWQFNFTPRWSAYGEVGPVLYLHSGWFSGGHFPGIGHNPDAWVAVTVGGKWHFAPQTSLTLAVGAPYVNVGLDFLL